MSSNGSKSSASQASQFELGDPVYTPTGEIAFVLAVDHDNGEATVYWPTRPEPNKADFRLCKLRKC